MHSPLWVSRKHAMLKICMHVWELLLESFPNEQTGRPCDHKQLVVRVLGDVRQSVHSLPEGLPSSRAWQFMLSPSKTKLVRNRTLITLHTVSSSQKCLAMLQSPPSSQNVHPTEVPRKSPKWHRSQIPPAKVVSLVSPELQML